MRGGGKYRTSFSYRMNVIRDIGRGSMTMFLTELRPYVYEFCDHENLFQDRHLRYTNLLQDFSMFTLHFTK